MPVVLLLLAEGRDRRFSDEESDPFLREAHPRLSDFFLIVADGGLELGAAGDGWIRGRADF